MKYAFVNGQRSEAQPNRTGECPCCGGSVIAKCGEIRVNHWAHRRGQNCDYWWERETEWHRNWKDSFPTHWQEFVHRDENGERHIADVKTDHDWVIEFQHSYLKPEERESRDAFYSKLIWVVDGTRRKRDVEHFHAALNKGIAIHRSVPVRRILPGRSALLREWANSPSQVFLDFGGQSVVWWLLAKRQEGPFYVTPFSRPEFIQIHLGASEEAISEFEKLVADLRSLASNYEAQFQLQVQRVRSKTTANGFQQYLARKSARRRL
ncbi:MAG: hypothetical protein GKR94_16425 [Gammaproteobacteria bacterium]|nr:hypothetical protein [Gammaproteobacteria bacterium]